MRGNTLRVIEINIGHVRRKLRVLLKPVVHVYFAYLF